MEAAGLVHRGAEPADGRVSLIALAPAGEKKMRTERRARRARIQELVSGWRTHDQVELGRLLGMLNDAICDVEHNRSADSEPLALASDVRRA
jgi:DNA-binding MarR family transcriptional regulator